MKNPAIVRLLGFTQSVMFHARRYLLGGDRAARGLGVTVGSGCRIYTTQFGSEPWLIRIGDRVTIAPGVWLLTHDGANWLFRDHHGRRYRYARIIIGDDVFIGAGAILLPGVVLESRVIVGAGSVVTRSVRAGNIVAGNPARVIGAYADLEKRAIRDHPSERDMKGSTFRERVERIVDETPCIWMSGNAE